MTPDVSRKSKAWLPLALLWGAAEGFLFFVVPDVIISLVAMRRGFSMGAIAALLAATGAMIGGAAMYGWSARDPIAARAAVAAIPAVSQAMIAEADADMTRDRWVAAALKGPLTSTPYKVYAMLAPSKGASLPAWAAAAYPVRLPRFLLVAAAFAVLGRVLEGRVSRSTLLGAFAIGWSLFYAWFWLSHPN